MTMIKNEIELTSYEQDELLNISDVCIDTILYITKDLICKHGMANVNAEDIREVIDENWLEE